MSKERDLRLTGKDKQGTDIYGMFPSGLFGNPLITRSKYFCKTAQIPWNKARLAFMPQHKHCNIAPEKII